jgi:hypothetical protein
MKIAAMMTIAVVAGMSVQARAAGQAGERKVTVCMERELDDNVADQAQVIASRMFANIGVRIDWHNSLRACAASPDRAIVVNLKTQSSKNDVPGVLASAQPFEGVHIQVLYDRVRRVPRRAPYLLAHVLVHEITHILQGICRHSETGVMKAQWNEDDYARMANHPLAFTDYDVLLIHSGLDARVSDRAMGTRAALIASDSQREGGNGVGAAQLQ